MERKFTTFGGAFLDIRKKHGFTQAEVAEVGVCHSQFISNAERGLCALPKDNIQLIMKRLKFSSQDRLKLEDAFIADRLEQARTEAKQLFRG